jgi:Tol biopolymer transport system component
MEMPTSHSRLRLPMVIAIASLALLAAGAAAYTLGWIQVTPSPLDLQEIRFRVDPPEKVRATMRPVVSPDGRYIAFVGFDQGGFPSLWIHTLATGLSKRLPGTERVVIISSAFWSPDSNALGFFADGKLKTVTLDGGAPVNLCDAIDGRGGAWNRSGDIVFAGTPNGPLFRVAAAGGAAQPVTDASGGNSHRFPYFLSDGDHFVFIASGDGGPRLLMGSLTSKSTKQLRTIDALAGTADRDQVLFVTQGHLFVQRIDMVAGALAGEMVDVTTLQPLGLVGTAWASASNNGTIVYRPTPTTGGDVVLAWVDRHGKATQVSLPPRAYRDISLSQDGRQIAMSLRDESGQHIWVYDTLRGSFGKRTFESQNAFPIWSRDGRSLTFATGEVQNGDVVRIDADGGGSGEALIKSSELSGQKVPTSWSADNMFLALQRGRDVYVRSADGKVTPLLASGGAFEREGRFAPSGRWIAYRSDETGRDEVYVQSYPLGNGKWQISTDGGAQAMWSAKGTELFYKNGNQLMAVPVEFEPTFKPGTPRLLFQMPLPESTVGDPSRYAVTPDGERFLVTTTETAALDDPPVHVILNWRGMHDTRQ